MDLKSKNTFLILNVIIFFLLGHSQEITQKNLDNFDSSSGWQIAASDQVEVKPSIVAGFKSNVLKLDFKSFFRCRSEEDYKI